jgi:hypothetical protein
MQGGIAGTTFRRIYSRVATWSRRDMPKLTIRLPDDQHDHLKTLAAQRGLSLNKLFEEFSTKAIAEFDTENHFSVRAARGDKARGLEILAVLDRKYAK